MFLKGQKVKRLYSSSRCRKGSIYTIAEVDYDGYVKLLEVPGRFHPNGFEYYNGKHKKKSAIQDDIKTYFVKQDKDSKKVLVYDFITKKLIDKVDDVGMFLVHKGRMGKLHGYIGYIQEVVTQDFIDEYLNALEDNYGESLNYFGYDSEYCIIKPNEVVNLDDYIYITDKVTGIKGLYEHHNMKELGLYDL